MRILQMEERDARVIVGSQRQNDRPINPERGGRICAIIPYERALSGKKKT